MYDINKIKPYSEFKYWFKPSKFSYYLVYQKEDDVCLQIGTLHLEDSLSQTINIHHRDFNGLESEIEDSFSDYLAFRPEGSVGSFADIPFDTVGEDYEDEMETQFEKILLGAYLIKTWEYLNQHSPDHTIEKFEEQCLRWLRGTDFYTAPSSTRYHDACKKGLVYHSLKVYNLMLDLCKSTSFCNISPVSIAITSLTHDWCKIGLYESYNRNVKNEQTGQWEQVTAYRHNQQGIPLGHGTTSMYLASRFFNLTTAELLAIRWHMSYWAVAPMEDAEMAMACDNYPLVQLIQFADQLSTREKYSRWD